MSFGGYGNPLCQLVVFKCVLCLHFFGSLEIVGQKVEPNSAPSFCSGEPPLDNPGLHYEEIIAADGVVEEYFAYDAS